LGIDRLQIVPGDLEAQLAARALRAGAGLAAIEIDLDRKPVAGLADDPGPGLIARTVRYLGQPRGLQNRGHIGPANGGAHRVRTRWRFGCAGVDWQEERQK